MKRAKPPLTVASSNSPLHINQAGVLLHCVASDVYAELHSDMVHCLCMRVTEAGNNIACNLMSLKLMMLTEEGKAGT